VAKGEIVESNFPDRFTGPGGRNRVRGGATDDGGHHDMGAAANARPPDTTTYAHGKANGDALSGSYSADRIGDIAGIDLQNRPGRSSVVGEQSRGLDLGQNLPTQRSVQQDIGNQVRPGSLDQTNKGDFGDKPGDSSKEAPYISPN
jgi:hypothetical protein